MVEVENILKIFSPPALIPFIASDAFIVVCEGPRREGKTVAGFDAMLYHKNRQPKSRNFIKRPYRGLIIRDTHENLKTQMCRTIQWIIGDRNLPLKFRDDYHKLEGTGIGIDLFGIDSLSDLSKLQGTAYDFIWIEEPAPVVERTGVEGISVECFLMCLTSVGTESDSIGRLQVTMNPADEEHWTYAYFHENVLRDKYKKNFAFFWIAPGANPYFKKEDRENLALSLQSRPDLLRRYVEGKPAFIIPGSGIVAKDYNEDYHRTKPDHSLLPTPGLECMRFWDGGFWPTCVIVQFQENGQLWVLDTIRSPFGQEGMEQHIQKNVNPVLIKKYGEIENWRDIGDPAICNRDQSDVGQAANKKIEELLVTGPTIFEKGIRTPHKEGAEAIRSILGRNVDGGPAILLSHHERLLHLALRGGWHNKTDSGGKVLGNPVKNIHSHTADSLAHGLGLVLPIILPGRVKRKRELSFSERHPQAAYLIGA